MLASPTNLNYLVTVRTSMHISFRMPMYRLFALLRREQFDWAIDLEHWPRLSALVAYISGAPVRMGFEQKGKYRHFLFKRQCHTFKDGTKCDFLDLRRDWNSNTGIRLRRASVRQHGRGCAMP